MMKLIFTGIIFPLIVFGSCSTPKMTSQADDIKQIRIALKQVFEDARVLKLSQQIGDSVIIEDAMYELPNGVINIKDIVFRQFMAGNTLEKIEIWAMKEFSHPMPLYLIFEEFSFTDKQGKIRFSGTAKEKHSDICYFSVVAQFKVKRNVPKLKDITIDKCTFTSAYKLSFPRVSTETLIEMAKEKSYKKI